MYSWIGIPFYGIFLRLLGIRRSFSYAIAARKCCALFRYLRQNSNFGTLSCMAPMKIEVYSDGSATVATKPGGFGWVLITDGVKHSEGFGHMELATNNDAEMEAAIQGLAAAFKYVHSLKLAEFQVTLCSDSQIVLGWANGNNRFKQVAKMAKFEMLRALMTRLKAGTRHVYGHTGDEHNERCDKLAGWGRKGREQELKADLEIKTNTKISTKKDGVVAFWYKGLLKIVDMDSNAVENYDKEVHGPRSSKMEIK